ncbi:unnamed protein product [Trifolium pratense]|uniref:Uncharacterized protein n=1 Tax=Trifolium pratense TaxID=57577 RepID=A0ACB0K9X2_TRIPR|nr:unnamed protein product [Trifolium pratense]
MHNLLLFSSMPTTTIIFIVFSVFSIFSIITFLCGTKKMKRLHTETDEEEAVAATKENKLISKINSKFSNKAISLVRMLSWRKVEDEGEFEEGNQEDEVLWRKNILMGEKCRPIDEEN